MILIPEAFDVTRYYYPDGSSIAQAPARQQNKWTARWLTSAVLRDSSDRVRLFDTAEEAARALYEGGEGPASLPANKVLPIVPTPREEIRQDLFNELVEACEQAQSSLRALLDSPDQEEARDAGEKALLDLDCLLGKVAKFEEEKEAK